MSTHTPGPWRAVFLQNGKDFDAATVNRAEFYSSEVWSGDDLILATADFAVKEDVPNFVLMAAAPEMLNALKMILIIMRLNYENEIKMVSDVIAKAEGRTS
jgi:hypothetical protein